MLKKSKKLMIYVIILVNGFQWYTIKLFVC